MEKKYRYKGKIYDDYTPAQSYQKYGDDFGGEYIELFNELRWDEKVSRSMTYTRNGDHFEKLGAFFYMTRESQESGRKYFDSLEDLIETMAEELGLEEVRDVES